MPPAIAAERICLGTMRLAIDQRSVSQWADFFAAAHDLGVRSVHVSHEYDTWPLFCEISTELAARDRPPQFRYVAKIAEPHFDQRDFDAERLCAAIDQVCDGLGTDCLHDVQWMWRGDLKDETGRLAQFKSQATELEIAVDALKARGRIERFLCFPYSAGFADAALDLSGIDGLVVYRNAAERDFDPFLDRCVQTGRIVHIIRPFLAGQTLEAGSPSPRNQLIAALDHPAIDYGILSTSRLDHLEQLIG